MDEKKKLRKKTKPGDVRTKKGEKMKIFIELKIILKINFLFLVLLDINWKLNNSFQIGIFSQIL